MWRHLDGAKRPPPAKPTAVEKSVRDTAYDQTKRTWKFQQHWINDYPWLEDGENSMHCKACRNNGDIADNSSSYVKESGCTNYTLKSVKGNADSKQHRKVEDRICNKARPLYGIASSDATVNNKPEDAERALTMLTTAVAARVNLLIRNAHAVAKHGRPYTDFTWMATLDGRKV